MVWIIFYFSILYIRCPHRCHHGFQSLSVQVLPHGLGSSRRVAFVGGASAVWSNDWLHSKNPHPQDRLWKPRNVGNVQRAWTASSFHWNRWATMAASNSWEMLESAGTRLSSRGKAGTLLNHQPVMAVKNYIALWIVIYEPVIAPLL